MVLQVKFDQVGTWLGIKRNKLVFIDEEPHQDLVIWLNTLTSVYIVRVLNTTR